jgi:O-antigen/teichoic acid export membrane protein
MKQIVIELIKMSQTQKGKQVASLYTSMVLVTLIGFGISIFNTRALGAERYGDYKFLEFLFTFFVTILSLGFFVSGGRLLAQRESENFRPQLKGGILIIALIMSVIMSCGVFIFSFFEERMFSNDLGYTIRIFALLMFVFPLRLGIGNLLPGENQIFKLSLFRLLPPLLYLLTAIFVTRFFSFTVEKALAIRYLSLAAIIIAVTCTLKPKLQDLGKSLSMIWRENTNYGFQVYLGMLASTATAQLGGIMVGYFVDNTSVGYFGLAVTTTMPLVLIPGVVGTTFFKSFANTNKISLRVAAITAGLTIASLVIFLLLIDKVITFFYPPEFAVAISLARILSVGSLLQGLGGFITHFLRAHGKGKELRNSALLVGIVNIFGYLVLVHQFGVTGAAYTRMIMGLVYCLVMLYYYFKITKLSRQTTI